MAAIEFAWMTYWPQLLVSERVHVTKCTGVCQKRARAAWEKNSGKSCGFMICDLAWVRDTMSMILRFFPHPSASCQRVCKSKESKGFLQTAACSGEASDWEGAQTRIVAAAFEAETTGTYCNLHFFTSLRSECPSPVFLLSSMWLQVPSGPPLHLAVQLLSQTLWRHGGLSMTFVSRFSHRIYNFQGPLAHRLAVGWKSTMFHRIPSDSIGSPCPQFGLPSQRIYPLMTTLVRAAMTHHHGSSTWWSPTVVAGIDFSMISQPWMHTRDTRMLMGSWEQVFVGHVDPKKLHVVMLLWVVDGCSWGRGWTLKTAGAGLGVKVKRLPEWVIWQCVKTLYPWWTSK